jgi:16S rRNA (cytosine1402-N4)-methyltransferase
LTEAQVQSPHRPVLLEEAVQALRVRSDGRYVDGTFGRGGHAAAILDRLGTRGRLLAIDKDVQAVQAARTQFGRDPRFSIEQGSFAMLERLVETRGWTGKIDGVLLDLGVSSPQLDEAARGFSFTREGPLDMRMDTTRGVTAAQWLAQASEGEIARVLKVFGEERYARRIARAIVAARAETPIETTGRLAAIISAASPSREKGKHPATRGFQAIRIYINRELEDLEAFLPQAVRVLATGGRLVVISFHSLEDRLVKRFMREQARGDQYPPDLPVSQDQLQPKLRVVGKPVWPSEDEVEVNPRARSAVMRVAERAA